MNKKLSCPDCGSMQIKIGRQRDYGRLRSYRGSRIFGVGSNITYYFCGRCGTVIKQVVDNPQRFDDYEQ
ncbi:hypothetical protein [Holzapfeliella sp. JNUCC 80]